MSTSGSSSPPVDDNDDDDDDVPLQPHLESVADDVPAAVATVLDKIISSVLNSIQAVAETVDSSAAGTEHGTVDDHEAKHVAAGAHTPSVSSQPTQHYSLCATCHDWYA